MIDLERALTDLADHLDYPAGDQPTEALRRRLTATVPGADRRRRTRALLAAAAMFAVVGTGVVAIAPARHAVADWLGIGAVEIRRSDRPPLPAPSTRRTVPGAPGSARAATAATRLAAARKVVKFAIVTPRRTAGGALADVEVDRRVPGGLVALTYPRFTLVEIATDATNPAPLAKQVGGGAAVEHVRVNGHPGLWIPAIHEIAFVDRDGNYETDTVRRSGPVLLWQRGDVTYRIEGLRTQAEARTIAASIP